MKTLGDLAKWMEDHDVRTLQLRKFPQDPYWRLDVQFTNAVERMIVDRTVLAVLQQLVGNGNVSHKKER